MAEKKRPSLRLWSLLVALLTLTADQVSKFFVVRYLGPVEHQTFLPLLGPLALTYSTNDGVSFGLLQGHSRWVALAGLAVAVGLLVAYRFLLTGNRWADLALGVILGGAWGNMTDRILTGLRYGLDHTYVVDFLYSGFWPTFNLADAAITVGGIAYGVYLLFFQHRENRAEARPWPEESTSPQEHVG